MPNQDIMDVHRASNEKRERAASVSKSGNGVECQPNASAPLLRDDKGRRDWIEHELDMCCQVRPSSLASLHSPWVLQHACNNTILCNNQPCHVTMTVQLLQ